MEAKIVKAQGHDSIIMVNKNKPEFASIMVRNDSMGLSETGFMVTEKRVGFITARTEEIEAMVKQFNLQEGDNFSAKAFPVKILVKESNTPFYDGQKPKINPETGEIINSGGLPVYRQTLVVPVSSPQEDEKMVTDRVEVTAATTAQAVDFEARV